MALACFFAALRAGMTLRSIGRRHGFGNAEGGVPKGEGRTFPEIPWVRCCRDEWQCFRAGTRSRQPSARLGVEHLFRFARSNPTFALPALTGQNNPAPGIALGFQSEKEPTLAPREALPKLSSLVSRVLNSCVSSRILRCKAQNRPSLRPAPAQHPSKAFFRCKTMGFQAPSSRICGKCHYFCAHEEAKKGERRVFFVDAVHFVMGSFLGMIWAFARIFVPTGSGRQRYNVLGAVETCNHDFVSVRTTGSITAVTICELITQIASLYPGEEITLVMDNARYQRNAKVTELAGLFGVELLYLPPYSPNLNLIERVWKLVKSK